MIDLQTLTGFDWDEANNSKNWLKHSVVMVECEQVFLNEPLWLFIDSKHTTTEDRYYVLGQTDQGRLLFISFTVRQQHLIRIISARPMNKKERLYYYEKTS